MYIDVSRDDGSAQVSLSSLSTGDRFVIDGYAPDPSGQPAQWVRVGNVTWTLPPGHLAACRLHDGEYGEINGAQAVHKLAHNQGSIP